MDCQTVREALGELLHGELEEESSRAVRAHIESCSACHGALEEEKALRRVLRTRLPRYHDPPSLWADTLRTIDRLEGGGAAVKRTKGIRWPQAALVAAAVLLVLGAALIFALSHRQPGPNRLVAELISDHIRNTMSGSPPPLVSSDPERLLTWVTGKVEFRLTIPPQKLADPQLVGARLTYALERRIPVLVYLHQERPISLFMVEAKGLATPEKNEREIRGVEFYMAAQKGYHLIGWKSAGFLYCLVADLPSEELLTFASAKAAS